MESKIHKNIFETTFDSFELDEGFLLKIGADLEKPKIGEGEKKLNHLTISNSEIVCKENKIADKKTQFEDISLFLEDLNESDFFESANSKKKKNPLKVSNNVPNKDAKIGSPKNKFTCCLSPILGPNLKNKMNSSISSTPLKPKNDLKTEEKKDTEKPDQNFLKVSEHEYLEADLFDDWDADVNCQKDFITLSQAFKIIEEAESARQSDQKDLNTSIDLLTGKPVGTDRENFFAESFGLPNLVESNSKKDSSDGCVIILEDSDAGSSPLIAQKANFENNTAENKNNFKINFNSDDDFDFLTQELLNKPKCMKNLTTLKGFSPNESSESIKKRGKSCRIIESDSADDSPDFKLNKKWSKKIRRQKDCKRDVAREFIESEAEVSDVVEVSSDELEADGDYDASFVDEGLYLTQNYSADMTAKYLESVKNHYCPGQFKIPAAKPYSLANVFSQIPEDNNTEYELDSFCVSEVEEEMSTDLTDLEVAENILKMDQKKRKRKRFLQ